MRDGPESRLEGWARSLTFTAGLGLVASVAVVVGGTLAGAGSPGSTGRLWSVPSVPVRPVMSLVPALFLFYGGLIGLVRAWLLLRRHVLRAGLPLVGLAGIIVLWSVPLLIGPPLGSRDVYAYAAQGRLAAEGYDPYQEGPARLGLDDPVLAPVDPLYRDAPVPYGPVFVFASSAIAQFSGDEVVVAVLAYRLIAVLGLLVAAFGVHDLARGLGRDPVDALVLAFANPLVLLHLVSGAHNEAMMLAFLVTGVAVGRRPRWRLAGVALCALAAAIKLPAILAVAFLTWPWLTEHVAWRVRAVRAAASAALTFAVIAAAGRLTGWGWGWVDALTGTTPVDAYLSITRLLGGAVSIATGADVAAALTVARLAGVAVAVGMSLWLLFRRSRSWPLALAWSLVIWAVLHPTTQPWYLTWGLMLLAATSAGQRNRALVTSCAVGAFLVLPVGPQLGLLLLDGSGTVTLALAALLLAILTVNPPPARPPRRRAGLDPALVSVVVPTRNERENVAPLVAAIAGAGLSRPVEVVFVDDSDDGTADEVRAVAAGAPIPVRVLARAPEDRWGGLGGAVVDGFDVAAGSVAVVMDGDLQHPPAVIDRLVEALDQGGHDLAVASRRVPGGLEDLGLTPVRRALSKAATWAAWAVFPARVGRVADPMSGYFAVRLGGVDLDRLSPDGFKILVELLATHPELSPVEIPFRFEGRRQGMSKASTAQAARFVGHLVDVRLRTSWVWAGAALPQRVFRSA